MKGRRSDIMKTFKKYFYPITVIIILLVVIGVIFLKKYLQDNQYTNIVTSESLGLVSEKEENNNE